MWIALLAGGVLILLILQKQQQGTPAGSKTAGSDPNQPVNTSTFSGFDNIARDLTAARLGFGAMTFGSEADPAYLNLTSDATPTLDGNPLDSIDVTSASPNSYRAPGVGLIAGFDLSHLIGALPTFANRFLGVPLPYVDQKFGVVVQPSANNFKPTEKQSKAVGGKIPPPIATQFLGTMHGKANPVSTGSKGIAPNLVATKIAKVLGSAVDKYRGQNSSIGIPAGGGASVLPAPVGYQTKLPIKDAKAQPTIPPTPPPVIAGTPSINTPDTGSVSGFSPIYLPKLETIVGLWQATPTEVPSFPITAIKGTATAA